MSTANTQIKSVLQHASDRLMLSMYQNKTDYFYDFLLAYGIPQAVIKQLRDDGLEHGVDDHGDVALGHNIYFMALPASEDPIQMLLGSLRFDANVYNDTCFRFDANIHDSMRFLFITNFNDVAAYDLSTGGYLFVPMAKIADNHSFFDALSAYNGPISLQKPSKTVTTIDTARQYEPSPRNNNLKPSNEVAAKEVVTHAPDQHPVDTDLLVTVKRSVDGAAKPLSNQKPAFFGSVARDGGNLLLSPAEKKNLLAEYPDAANLVRPLIRTTEFLSGTSYFALWLEDATKKTIDANPLIKYRVDNVERLRKASKSEATSGAYAEKPHLFAPSVGLSEEGWLAFNPSGSSSFDYMPFEFLDAGAIVALPMCIISNANLFDFAVLMSRMHNIWIKAMSGGRLNARTYRIRADYNTFPWPNSVEGKPYNQHIQNVVQNVLLAREEYPNRSLAELYNPKKMPDNLREAHKALDLAVDRLYRDEPFKDNKERLEHLFMRYEKLVANEAASKNLKTLKAERSQ